MPNGGSDCCGTCWFNTAKDESEGQAPAPGREPGYCRIRSLDVSCSPEGPYYTYCANHPHRNPDRIETPLGPVFVGDSEGNRQVWFLSPDTEEIRQALIGFVESMGEQPHEEYPLGVGIEEVVIWQLAEFGETRAIPSLRRLLTLDPEARAPGPFPLDRQNTMAVAQYALERLDPPAG